MGDLTSLQSTDFMSCRCLQTCYAESRRGRLVLRFIEGTLEGYPGDGPVHQRSEYVWPFG